MKKSDFEEAEERISESIRQAVEAFPYLANWQANFAESNRLFEEKSLSQEGLARAVFLWELLPLYAAAIVRDLDGSTEEIQSGLVHFESIIFHSHELAVEALMRLAESKKIDSGPIEASGRYCRELCRRGDAPNPYCSKWLDCLSEKLFAIPGDIRYAIVTGNACVKRLVASIGTRRAVLTPSLPSEPVAKQKPEKPIPSTTQKIIKLSEAGIKPKEITNRLNREGEDVSQTAVRTAKSRYYKKHRDKS